MYNKSIYVNSQRNANLPEAPDVWEGIIDRHVPAGAKVETGFPGVAVVAPDRAGKYTLWEQTRCGILYGYRWEREHRPHKALHSFGFKEDDHGTD